MLPDRVSHYTVDGIKFDTIGDAIAHIVYGLACRKSQVYVTFTDVELITQTKLILDFVTPENIVQYKV